MIPKHRLLVPLAAALGLVLSREVDAQERRVRGTVADSAGRALAFAHLLVGPRVVGSTNQEGKYAFALSVAPTTVTVRRMGFLPVDIRIVGGGDTNIAVTLTPVPQTLSAVDVGADAIASLQIHGFYDRMLARQKGIGSATFITAEEIEARRPYRATQIMENVPGVRIIRYGSSSSTGNSTGLQSWVITGTDRCWMTVYVNNNRIWPPARYLRDTRRPLDRDEFVDNLVVPTDVAGVEVYVRGAGAPSQFQMMNGTCGIVVFWTK